jgi:septal ring factor EnvC (AmiA/AmiB activator)
VGVRLRVGSKVFKLGNEKGVKSKDLEKHYNKTPLAELAFDLFACLNVTKRQLGDQNRQLAKATNALKEQDRKIQKLDTSLEEMENTAAEAEQSTLAEVLAEVKKNGERITEMETKMKKVRKRS